MRKRDLSKQVAVRAANEVSEHNRLGEFKYRVTQSLDVRRHCLLTLDQRISVERDSGSGRSERVLLLCDFVVYLVDCIDESRIRYDVLRQRSGQRVDVRLEEAAVNLDVDVVGRFEHV